MKTRAENIEQFYRNSVADAIMQLLLIMEPGGKMELGIMTYSELVKYGAKRLAAESLALSFDEEQKSPPEVEGDNIVSSVGLSLAEVETG